MRLEKEEMKERRRDRQYNHNIYISSSLEQSSLTVNILSKQSLTLHVFILFGQRPRRGPEGTLVLCNRGNLVHSSVRTYIRPPWLGL